MKWGTYNIRLYLRYFIGLSVIAALIYHVQYHESIMPVLRQFDFAVLFPTFIFILAHLVCLFAMWRTIIYEIGRIDSSFHLLFHSFFGGRTLGFITPGHTGELLKGLFFAADLRLKGTSLSMIYQGYSMLVRIALGFIASIYFILRIPELF